MTNGMNTLLEQKSTQRQEVSRVDPWHITDKWDGYNGHLMNYASLVRSELYYQSTLFSDDSLAATIRHDISELFHIIFQKKVNSEEEFGANPLIQRHLKTVNNRKFSQFLDSTFERVMPNDLFFTDPPESEYFTRFSQMITEVLLASTDGSAFEVLRVESSLNRHGIKILKALIRTFGRGKEHNFLEFKATSLPTMGYF